MSRDSCLGVDRHTRSRCARGAGGSSSQNQCSPLLASVALHNHAHPCRSRWFGPVLALQVRFLAAQGITFVVDLADLVDSAAQIILAPCRCRTQFLPQAGLHWATGS